jgi:hypothetical protein
MNLFRIECYVRTDKIFLIKMLRVLKPGLGLKDSKDMVEGNIDCPTPHGIRALSLLVTAEQLGNLFHYFDDCEASYIYAVEKLETCATFNMIGDLT